MALNTKVKKRLAEAVVKSYYKSWYQRWWGRVALIILGLLLLLFVYFIYLTIQNINHLRNGDIRNDLSRTWVTEAQFRENQKLSTELLTGDDPWLGAEEPIVYVVAYESFGCPYCQDNQVDIKQLLQKFSSIVRFIAKDFPGEGLHPNVMNAHLAAACANEQGRYWEYRDVLYANQATEETPENFSKDNLNILAKGVGLNMQQFKLCLDEEKYAQEIRQDFASGVQIGAVGTPSYLINGNLIPGEIKFDIWEKIIGFIIKSEQK